MTLFSRVLSLFGLGGLFNPDEGTQSSGPASRSTDAGITVSDDRAMAISALWACVRVLVQSGGSLPLGFYERTDTVRRPMPDDHYLVDLLKRRPNQFMTAKQFRKAMWCQRVLWGNAYAHVLKNSRGRPLSIVPLQPEHVTPVRQDDGIIYRYSSSKGEREFSQDEILHIKGFSPDGIVGLTPLGYARHTLGIAVSADKYASKSFSTTPSFVMETDKILTKENRDQLRKLYTEMGNSAIGDGSFWILEAGLNRREIGIQPNDLQMLESRQFQVSEIARYFGVPTVMIDGQAGSTAAWPASYEQQVLSFLTFTLKDYLEEWEDAIPDALLTPADRRKYYIEHSVEGFLRTDTAARTTFYSTALQNGWMNRNEVRAKENLPPIEGGDEYTVQVNLTPLEMLEKIGEQNAPQR